MLTRKPFVPVENQVLEIVNGVFGAKVTVRNTPVSMRENIRAAFYEKKPYWMTSYLDMLRYSGPWDQHLARGTNSDFLDDFGIQWVFEPVAGGSIVRGDAPQLLNNVNEWKEKVKLPNVDDWGWEEAQKKATFDPRFAYLVNITNGFWFERLISFMGFINAACALVDEEQEDAIHELFGALTDIGCQVIDKYCEYFPAVDVFCIHDDWGSQMAPFFSEDIAREFFLPYMKKLTDCIHRNGRIASLHSCGHNESRTEIFIEAGFDEWQPQTMNNIHEMYEKYGDKIVLGVWPDRTDIAQLSEEEQRAEARKFVDTYTVPGKVAMMSVGVRALTAPAFMDEVYEYSRKKYLEQ